MTVRRRVARKVIGLLGAAGAVAVIVALPPSAKPVPAEAALPTARGAFHIHSNRSDGSGTLDQIAAAAARAGLHFIIVTDHGDGTRTPEPPSYRSGVLTIDAVELSTTGGHYAAIALPATPYPFAGTPQDVTEDVRRLGGFGIAAHPGSPRPSLRWQDWDAEFDGVEWINADSEWRDELWGSLGRTLLTYAFRGPETLASLLDRPDAVLSRWDAAGTHRRVVGLAGSDAHARLGFRQRTDPETASMSVPLPGYEVSFRAFSNRVELEHPFTGDAVSDSASVITAIRGGRVFTVIDGLASPGAFTFTGTSGAHSAMMGGELALDGVARLRAHVAAPPNTTMALWRDGKRITESHSSELDVDVTGVPGVYRVEATIAGGPGQPPIPWIVSNPIYVGLSYVQPLAEKPADSQLISVSLDSPEVEKGQDCESTATTRQGARNAEVTWQFGLSPGQAAGQFAALRLPVSSLGQFTRVRARVSADRPMRAWMQLRAPVGATERWGRTFYADAEERLIDLPLSGFMPIGTTSSPLAPLDKVDSLLFVVDTLNTLPGRGGTLRITLVELAR